jgi:type IV pilus assembly protein PilB
MAQRLVRRICENCKEEYTPGKDVMDLLGIDADPLKGKKLVHGKGCNHCRDTGYLGRIGIFELIAMSRDLRQMVFENASEDDIRAQAVEEGMITLRVSGIRKVKDGITTVEEVLRSTVADS